MKTGIRYQLFILTSKVALSTLILLSVVYSIYLTIFTDGRDEYSWIPTTHDWVLTLISGLLSSVVALGFAWSFARKVIIPLNAVAESARKIAEGQLSERATHSVREIRETALLVDDFNTMADKLEVMSSEMKKWNAAIAHELRTPVTVLQGRIQGILDGVFEKDDRQFLLLLNQTEGLSRLIDDLRVLSLSDSGQLYLYRETVQMDQLIVTSVELFRDELERKGLTPAIDAEQMTGFVDKIRISQILSALLSNAIKYAIPGKILITCHLVKGDIRITVEDEGPGIPPQDIAAIFDAFYRADNVRSARTDGSGLGLAVVSSIARAHGGQVSCGYSALGGSCIEIVLPAEIN
ncbi:ATP-binding protein [Pectobacterium punjabense]|uniref:ATP-binding protein n=1 Tax=Pectobacterium punjabense TaxID=2108399 RepID=UPI0019695851|nr:ATP-binding protein [Pectobacterium punjabense]MBN3138182.1 two-component sensor histidine kinase [Pectobacterium punjabense]MCE5380130.1 two-component sensor histidine kinase [Pectobacterium punjabense]